MVCRTTCLSYHETSDIRQCVDILFKWICNCKDRLTTEVKRKFVFVLGNSAVATLWGAGPWEQAGGAATPPHLATLTPNATFRFSTAGFLRVFSRITQ